MLIMDVPIDFEQTESKEWFGLTLRQLICAICAAVIVGIAICCQLVPAMRPAKDIANDLLPFLIVPIALMAVWKPEGMRPEVFVRYWWRQRHELDQGPITISGQTYPDRRTKPLPASIAFDDDPETPIDFLTEANGRKH